MNWVIYGVITEIVINVLLFQGTQPNNPDSESKTNSKSKKVPMEDESGVEEKIQRFMAVTGASRGNSFSNYFLITLIYRICQ